MECEITFFVILEGFFIAELVCSLAYFSETVITVFDGISVSVNETVINPPAELGRLTDAGGGEQSIKIENSAV